MAKGYAFLAARGDPQHLLPESFDRQRWSRVERGRAAMPAPVRRCYLESTQCGTPKPKPSRCVSGCEPDLGVVYVVPEDVLTWDELMTAVDALRMPVARSSLAFVLIPLKNGMGQSRSRGSTCSLMLNEWLLRGARTGMCSVHSPEALLSKN